MHHRWRYLCYGLVFLLVLQFMVQIQIHKDWLGFGVLAIIHVVFMLLTSYANKWVPAKPYKEMVLYGVYGLLGLVVLSTIPVWDEAVSPIMLVTYWGGAVMFARMMTDTTLHYVNRYALWFFTGGSLLAIIIGFVVPQQERLDLLLSMLLYGFMHLFYLWYWIIEWMNHQQNI